MRKSSYKIEITIFYSFLRLHIRSLHYKYSYRYWMRTLSVFFLLLPIISICGNNSQDNRPTLNIIKIDKPIKISGKLNDPLWLLADPIELKYEINPGDNSPAKERTVMRALYDEENLYFGFKCYDSDPAEIRANYSERDKIFSDDYVIINIDTYGDYQKAYEFGVNPYGIQGDLLATISGEDISFDLTWFSKAAINDSGWTAEIAIPFISLNFDETENPIWAFNAWRTIPRSSSTQNNWTGLNQNIPTFL